VFAPQSAAPSAVAVAQCAKICTRDAVDTLVRAFHRQFDQQSQKSAWHTLWARSGTGANAPPPPRAI